jgi:hypothetical protein
MQQADGSGRTRNAQSVTGTGIKTLMAVKEDPALVRAQ